MKKWHLATAVFALLSIHCSSSSPTPASVGSDSGGAGTGSHGGPEADSGTAGSSRDAAATADGDTDASTPSPGAVDAKLIVDVPAGYHGTPRELDVVVVPQLPVAGPPAGILYQAKSPTVVAGQALTVHGDASGITGTNYVVAVLYMQGGGTFSPAPGVDYEAQSTAPASFDGKPIDLGTLHLELVSGDGGP